MNHKIPKRVRPLFERAIALPLPPGWAEVLANILTTGAMPNHDECRHLSQSIDRNVSYLAYRLNLLIYVVQRYMHPWRTIAVKRHLRHLECVIVIAENESQNP
jgi:hypothetical protein